MRMKVRFRQVKADVGGIGNHPKSSTELLAGVEVHVVEDAKAISMTNRILVSA